MDLSHQARLNGVVFLKIDGAVLEILMKNIFLKMVPPAKTAAF